jgi:ABC-type antimicrobial peptide transport system permease subunit
VALSRWGRGLSSLVFQVSPWDPRIMAASVLMLVVASGIAAWLPARRAARVAPREAMGAPEL